MTRLLSVLLLFLVSCTTPSPQKLNPEVYYKQDICVTYRRDLSKHGEIGTWYRNKVKRKFRLFRKNKRYQEIYMCGVGVLPQEESYSLEINHKAKHNLFIANSCHREITSTNPDKGLFKKDGRLNLTYTPTLEQGRACPLYLASYNKLGRNGWGTLAFESGKYQLEATVDCNGDQINFNGTSICQSRFGTLQRITFPEAVIAARPVNGPAERKADCPELKSSDNKVFEFVMPPRECYYGFIGRKTGKAHKLYTIGYEQLIVRDI